MLLCRSFPLAHESFASHGASRVRSSEIPLLLYTRCTRTQRIDAPAELAAATSPQTSVINPVSCFLCSSPFWPQMRPFIVSLHYPHPAVARYFRIQTAWLARSRTRWYLWNMSGGTVFISRKWWSLLYRFGCYDVFSKLLQGDESRFGRRCEWNRSHNHKSHRK